jgi:hypothetical protein
MMEALSSSETSVFTRATRLNILYSFGASVGSYLRLTLFLVHRFLSTWWWRRLFPPKHRFLQEPHGVTFQRTPFWNVLFLDNVLALNVCKYVDNTGNCRSEYLFSEKCASSVLCHSFGTVKIPASAKISTR